MHKPFMKIKCTNIHVPHWICGAQNDSDYIEKDVEYHIGVWQYASISRKWVFFWTPTILWVLECQPLLWRQPTKKLSRCRATLGALLRKLENEGNTWCLWMKSKIGKWPAEMDVMSTLKFNLRELADHSLTNNSSNHCYSMGIGRIS